MSVVLRVREYRSIAEARKDLVSFQLPNLPPAVLLYGTVIMAEGKVSELLPLSYEARDLDGKAYSGRRGGRDDGEQDGEGGHGHLTAMHRRGR